MHIYIVKLYYQIQLYTGWSGSLPKRKYLRRVFFVKSSRTMKGLETVLSMNCSDGFLHVKVDGEIPSSNSSISEECMTDLIRHAQIDIDFNKDENTIRKQGITAQSDFERKLIDSEELYQGAKETNTVSIELPFQNVKVVRLQGLLSPGVFQGDKCIIPFGKYDWIDDYSEGFARFISDNKWGIINTEGLEVIPAVYDDIRCLNIIEKYYMCYKGGQPTRIYISDLQKS